MNFSGDTNIEFIAYGHSHEDFRMGRGKVVGQEERKTWGETTVDEGESDEDFDIFLPGLIPSLPGYEKLLMFLSFLFACLHVH
jgi:hypothetical protein